MLSMVERYAEYFQKDLSWFFEDENLTVAREAGGKTRQELAHLQAEEVETVLNSAISNALTIISLAKSSTKAEAAKRALPQDNRRPRSRFQFFENLKIVLIVRASLRFRNFRSLLDIFYAWLVASA